MAARPPTEAEKKAVLAHEALSGIGEVALVQRVEARPVLESLAAGKAVDCKNLLSAADALAIFQGELKANGTPAQQAQGEQKITAEWGDDNNPIRKGVNLAVSACRKPSGP